MAGTGSLVLHRYVKALFEASTDAGSQEAIGRDLEFAAEMLEDRAVREFFLHPRIRPATKVERFVDPLRAHTSALFVSFCEMCIRRGREAVLVDAGRIFRRMVGEAHGEREGTVEVARPLGEEARANLERSLTSRLGVRVVLTEKLDPSLVGGARVRVGDTLIDGTVAGRTARLRRTWQGARLTSASAQDND